LIYSSRPYWLPVETWLVIVEGMANAALKRLLRNSGVPPELESGFPHLTHPYAFGFGAS
jgi:hypothetical protein